MPAAAPAATGLVERPAVETAAGVQAEVVDPPDVDEVPHGTVVVDVLLVDVDVVVDVEVDVDEVVEVEVVVRGEVVVVVGGGAGVGGSLFAAAVTTSSWPRYLHWTVTANWSDSGQAGGTWTSNRSGMVASPTRV